MKDFAKKMSELDMQAREVFMQMLELIQEYDRSEDETSGGIEGYHAIQNACCNYLLNGAQLIDEYHTQVGNIRITRDNPRSAVYKANKYVWNKINM